MKKSDFTTGLTRGDTVWVSSQSSNFYKFEFVIFDFDYKNQNIICQSGDEVGLSFKRDEIKRVIQDARENKK